MARFDKFNAEKNSATPSVSQESSMEPVSNGHEVKREESEPPEPTSSPISAPATATVETA